MRDTNEKKLKQMRVRYVLGQKKNPSDSDSSHICESELNSEPLKF